MDSSVSFLLAGKERAESSFASSKKRMETVHNPSATLDSINDGLIWSIFNANVDGGLQKANIFLASLAGGAPTASCGRPRTPDRGSRAIKTRFPLLSSKKRNDSPRASRSTQQHATSSSPSASSLASSRATPSSKSGGADSSERRAWFHACESRPWCEALLSRPLRADRTTKQGDCKNVGVNKSPVGQAFSFAVKLGQACLKAIKQIRVAKRTKAKGFIRRDTGY